MGETDRYNKNNFSQRRRIRITLGADGNALMALFAINVIFFLLLMVIQVGMFVGEQTPEFFYTHVVKWFEMPASLTKFTEQPWAILIYMFTDTGNGIMRLLSNMIWLWAFGYVLQQMAGNNKVIPIYIYGGLLGAIFFVGAHYILSPLAPFRESAGLLGANAGVLAVAMATTTLEPGFRFFTQIRGGIPIWVLMSIYLLIDFAGVAGYGAGHSLSHLGGALAGFLFVVFLRRGKDGSIWMNDFYRWVTTLFEPKAVTKVVTKDKVFYKTGDRKPFIKAPNITQEKVDAILDKINQKGYNFLTAEEKEFLKKASEGDTL